MSKILIKILAKIFRWELVLLLDYDGDEYISIIRYTPSGKMYCYVHPFEKVGFTILHEDGRCEGPCSIKEWWDY